MQHISWASLDKEVMNEKIWRRVISGQKTMVAQIFLTKGAVVPVHQHANEQISYVIEGALKYEVEGREGIIRAGEVLHIPSNVFHGALALEDTLNLDIFSPIRADWLAVKDGHLHQLEPAQR